MFWPLGTEKHDGRMKAEKYMMNTIRLLCMIMNIISLGEDFTNYNDAQVYQG